MIYLQGGWEWILNSIWSTDLAIIYTPVPVSRFVSFNLRGFCFDINEIFHFILTWI